MNKAYLPRTTKIHGCEAVVRGLRNIFLFFFGLYLGAGLLSGCTAIPVTEGIKPVGVNEFADIPIPAELKKSAKESFLYQSGSITTALFVYNSWPKFLEHSSLISFFEENMKKNGWKFQNTSTYGGVINLNYEKESRKATITIYDTTLLNTRLEIKIGPK